MFYTCGFDYLICLYEGENKNVLILNIDDQNLMHIFASKGTYVAYLINIPNNIKAFN